MNLIMPFMLLGFGIDDMFVIVQNFDTLEEHTAMLPLHEVREKYYSLHY